MLVELAVEVERVLAGQDACPLLVVGTGEEWLTELDTDQLRDLVTLGAL